MVKRLRRLSPGARRLLRARRNAAKELNLPPSAWQTRALATMTAALEAIQLRMATGGAFNVDNLVRLDSEMRAIRESIPKPPILVQLEIVESPPSAIERCPSCGWCHGDAAPVADVVDVTPRLLPPPSSTPRPIYGMLDDGYWAGGGGK